MSNLKQFTEAAEDVLAFEEENFSWVIHYFKDKNLGAKDMIKKVGIKGAQADSFDYNVESIILPSGTNKLGARNYARMVADEIVKTSSENSLAAAKSEFDGVVRVEQLDTETYEPGNDVFGVNASTGLSLA